MARVDYPIHNKPAKHLLSLVDRLLSPLSKSPKPIPPPKKLLLCNGAHLGDVILTTSLLPPLKSAYPDLQIGILVGSWSKPVIENHPLIDQIHTVDHWKVNRSPLSLPQKLFHYQKTRRVALQEIKELDYDVAVDCPFHFPNFAPLLFQAKIPARLGFTSAGFGPLLTHPCDWKDREQSAVFTFFSLLENTLSLHPFRDQLRPSLPPVEEKQSDNNYLVLHIGSGDPSKEWPKEKWRELAQKLLSSGYRLVFTGLRAREKKIIDWITHDLSNIENLCDRQNFQEFVATIKGAKLLIGVDSAAGHVAAAVDTPSILLYTDLHPPNLWKPFSPKAHLLADLHSDSTFQQVIDLVALLRKIDTIR